MYVYKQTYTFILGKAPLYLKLHIPLRARLTLYLSKIQEITEHEGNQSTCRIELLVWN